MQFNRSLGPLTVKGDVRAVFAGVVLLGLLSNLGFWQLGRAGEKAALEDRWQARAAEPAVTPRALTDQARDPADRQVRWEGEFRAGDYLLLDNRLHRGQPGFHVIALASAGDAVVRALIPYVLRRRAIAASLHVRASRVLACRACRACCRTCTGAVVCD